MPRTRALQPVAPPNTDQADLRALTAAGKRLPVNPDYTKVSKSARGWQDTAWSFYDTVGEYRYACDWVGNMISKATLFVAKDGVRVEGSSPGVDYMYSLFGGPESQGQILREIGIHLTVAGENYVIGVTHDDVEEWRVVAATELTVRAGTYYASSKAIESDGDPFVMRLWRPHPRKYREANSPSRAILSILAELDALTKRIFAEIDSRLAGAGVLLLPSEMTMPVTQTAAADGALQSTATVADAFRESLQTAMMTAIADRENASAMVPIVATVPGEHVGQIKHLTFWSPLDEKSIELRTEAIRRLALGLDMPPEVLTGVADTNHWNAWQVEEAAIKAHAEPLLALVCESFTEGYLRPLLVQDGMDPADADQYTVVADTSMLRLRPNRSKEAFELYDRMQLDGAALRRETGFDEADAPDNIELRELFLRKVASGSTTPELVAAALKALGVPIGAVGSTIGTEERPVPSLEGHPTQEPPEQIVASSPPSDDGLLGASEVIVVRALERVGRRIQTQIRQRIPDVADADVYLRVPVNPNQLDSLLKNSFDDISKYVGCRQVPADRLLTCLDTYCRALITESRAHDPQVLASYLAMTKASA